MEAKDRRRIQAGGVLTFLFENTATIRYQVQEMVRAERMTREADIAHELATYNELLGGKGELGVSLLIEIPYSAERDRKLREWIGAAEEPLPAASKRREGAAALRRTPGRDRLALLGAISEVRPEGEAPVALGADLDGLTVEEALTADQRKALSDDLSLDG